MNLLVTGTDGYIGVLLAPYLMQKGHTVTGVDTGFYREGWLYQGASDQGPRTIQKDIRLLTESDLHGFDAVLHLAELSNDPLGQLNPNITFKINHQGSVDLARKAKAAGVKRFIYTSSCSVYGFGGDDFKSETSDTNPQTAYAQCKVNVEKDVGALASDQFSPVFLRNATAYGASPRMRFDIVLNNLCGLARTVGEIRMISDGTPWRPLVHVLDICRAVGCAVEAPQASIHNQIFNVGDSKANYRVREIAEIVAEAFPGCQLSFGKSDPDNRSYRVSFDKIHSQLPGFACDWDAQKGTQQFKQLFDRIQMTAEQFQARPFTRLKTLEYLIRTEQIDGDFFWRPLN